MPFAKYSAPRSPSPPIAADAPITAPSLAQALSSEPALARRAQYLDALVALASPASAAALAALLAHTDPAVRAAGVEGLRRSPPELARPEIARLLDDPLPDTRIRALDAIERVPDAQVESWLIALLDRETQANVCGATLDLLAEVGTSASLMAIRAARLRFANEPFIAFAADLAIAQIAEG
jgi:HEAT repeat protein